MKQNNIKKKQNNIKKKQNTMKKQQTAKTNKNNIVKLRPSSAEIWSHCSKIFDYDITKNIFRDDSRAQWGTLIHTVAENYIYVGATHRWPSFDEVSKLSELHSRIDNELSIKEATIFKKNYDIILEYVEFYYKRIRNDYRFLEDLIDDKMLIEFYVEKSLKHAGKNFSLSGTADCIIYAHPYLYVYDLKTGMYEVLASSNLQLQTYAQTFIEQFIKPTSTKELQIIGTIIQPSLRVVNSSDILYDEKFWQRIEQHVDDSKNSRKYNVGTWCKFCPVNDICPALKKHIKKFLNPKYQDEQINRVEVWSDILEISTPIVKTLEQVKSSALEATKNGIDIPGWSVSSRNGRRGWSNNMSASALAKYLGIRKKDVVKEKIDSPAQVEKKLKSKKQKEKFREIVGQPLIFYLRKDDEVGQ